MAVDTVPQNSPNESTLRRPPKAVRRRSEAVFEALERDIVLGHLKPREALLELDLAYRFDCSQSTVREALLRLQEEGLVQRMSQRGTIVVDCRAEDAHELLCIRHDIECRGVERALSCEELPIAEIEDALEAMRAAAEAEDEFRLTVEDRRFHLALFAAARLPAVQPILMRCLIHNHRYKIANSAPNRALMETANRHVAIFDAVRARDVAAARAALSHHIATIVDLGPSIIEPAL